MPREIITIQVGQCGNQVGCRFWEMALREHAAAATGGRAAGGAAAAPRYDEALSTFFRNVDARGSPPRELPPGGPIRTLKARAVLVDMEEGVVAEMLRGPLADIFDARQLLTDVSGAGNNWAHGHCLYGPQYREALLERVRQPAEACDSLQAFLLMHSLGGGTGSGLGTYLLQELADVYPEVYRFGCSVFPSESDDVVTSPYNALLAAAALAEHADCVFPVENQALMDICGRIDENARRAATKGSTAAVTGPDGPAGTGGGAPFDAMNGIAASMLLHLTSSVRFEGSLNVDINDISMNLVPFPRMHFLLSSMAPLAAPADVAKLAATPRGIDQAFTEIFARENQLMRADPRRSTYLACGLLFRGPVLLSDVSRNVARLQPHLRMAHWNPDGFKLGLCAVPPVGRPFAALALANSCCFGGTLGAMRERFDKLYRRRVYVHHYTQYMEAAGFDSAAGCIDDLIAEYAAQDSAPAPESVTRLRPLGVL